MPAHTVPLLHISILAWNAYSVHCRKTASLHHQWQSVIHNNKEVAVFEGQITGMNNNLSIGHRYK